MPKYKVIVWEQAEVREFDDLNLALKTLESATVSHGPTALGRVEDQETNEVINEYYQPGD